MIEDVESAYLHYVLNIDSSQLDNNDLFADAAVHGDKEELPSTATKSESDTRSRPADRDQKSSENKTEKKAEQVSRRVTHRSFRLSYDTCETIYRSQPQLTGSTGPDYPWEQLGLHFILS